MKAAFLVYNQAFVDEVEKILHDLSIRGYTRWDEVKGQGTTTGEPHFGSHAWPSKNMATLCIIEDDIAIKLNKRILLLDEDAPEQGIRIFFWDTITY